MIACGDRCGFHDQLAGLGNGHEEAGDVRMGDRHRSAFGDLFAETRDYRAVRAEDVSETGGYELRGPLDRTLFDGQPERLYVNFGQAFGTAHDIGGIHGLVGRDHHHLFDVVFQAFQSDVACADDIDQHRFAGIFLHQGDVFVSGGVEYDLGMERAEGEIQAVGQPDVADHGDEFQLREALFEFEPQVVHRGFCIVEQDQFLDSERCQLAAQFRADRTGGSGDHDGFFPEIGDDFVQ